MEIVVLLLVGTLGPIIAAMAVYFTAVKQGYGSVASDLRDQRGALVVTLKDRLQAVEDENGRLRDELEAERKRVSKMERENEDLRSRIGKLESALGDLAVEGNLHGTD